MLSSTLDELCSCLVSSYFKYTSLAHVDLGDSKLLTIVEVQQEVKRFGCNYLR